jgi:hypothetical protein
VSDDSNDEQVEEQETPKPKLVYEVTIDEEGTPKGQLIQIPGLGTFENGSTFDVDEDQHAQFRAYHTTTTPVEDEEGNLVIEDGTYVYETELGPTLLQASKGMNGVEVVTYATAQNRKEGDD